MKPKSMLYSDVTIIKRIWDLLEPFIKGHLDSLELERPLLRLLGDRDLDLLGDLLRRGGERDRDLLL